GRSADIHTDDILQAFPGEPDAKLENADDRRTRGARNVDDVTGMIGVAVGEEDHVSLVDPFVIRRTLRVAFEPRVDDDAFAAGSGDDESGVPEPRNRERRHAGSIMTLRTIDVRWHAHDPASLHPRPKSA